MALSEAVQTLERELRGVFGSRLQSLITYGMRGEAAPPIRTMALVESLSEEDLRACAARARAWHDAGLATPLLLPAQEFARSLDVFPLELGAIMADHVVVSGAPPFDRLAVDAADVRRACEVQARGHLLHLREGFVEAAGNNDALAVLLVQSAPALSVLLKSIARLDGRTDNDAAAAGRRAERILGVAGGTMTDVIELAHVHEISGAEAARIFPAHLGAVERLVEYVDGWSSR